LASSNPPKSRTDGIRECLSFLPLCGKKRWAEAVANLVHDCVTMYPSAEAWQIARAH